MSNEIKIWQVNDSEWWIGPGTAEQILAAYMDEYRVSHEDATGDNETMPAELNDEAMDSLMFTDSDEDGSRLVSIRTFREQLVIEVSAGGAFPRMFASSEW